MIFGSPCQVWRYSAPKLVDGVTSGLILFSSEVLGYSASWPSMCVFVISLGACSQGPVDSVRTSGSGDVVFGTGESPEVKRSVVVGILRLGSFCEIVVQRGRKCQPPTCIPRIYIPKVLVLEHFSVSGSPFRPYQEDVVIVVDWLTCL